LAVCHTPRLTVFQHWMAHATRRDRISNPKEDVHVFVDCPVESGALRPSLQGVGPLRAAVGSFLAEPLCLAIGRRAAGPEEAPCGPRRSPKPSTARPRSKGPVSEATSILC
jgi:hypothetical protein